MKRRFFYLTVFGLALCLAALPVSPALAGEAEKKEPAPAKEEKKAAAPEKPAVEKPAGLVGTVIAVVPASRTLVVDVPLGKEVLRVGAEVTETTKIMAGGKAMFFEPEQCSSTAKHAKHAKECPNSQG